MTDEPGAAAGRFAALADTYGADVRRWPSAERRAADALPTGEDDRARAILTRAADLDRLLDQYRVPAPSSALVGRILTTMPQPGLLWSRARLWWSGLGLAGVGLAGAVTGAIALSLATPGLLHHRAAAWADGQTIFGDVDLDGIAR